jgi:hypothetical protein
MNQLDIVPLAIVHDATDGRTLNDSTGHKARQEENFVPERGKVRISTEAIAEGKDVIAPRLKHTVEVIAVGGDDVWFDSFSAQSVQKGQEGFRRAVGCICGGNDVEDFHGIRN